MISSVRRSAARSFGLVMGACLPIGVGVGWLWARLVSDAGVVAANLTLGALAFGAGLAWSTIAMLSTGRRHPDAVMWGSVVGGLLGSMVAYRLGLLIGSGSGDESVGGLTLRAPGVLLMWSLAACLVGFGVGVARRMWDRTRVPTVDDE